MMSQEIRRATQLEMLPVMSQEIRRATQLEMLPVMSQEIRRATQRDPLLSKVQEYTLKGWPTRVTKPLQPYQAKLAEVLVEEGCLMWGRRVIVPDSLKEAMKAGKGDGLTLQHRLQNFLLTYRTTPHSTTGTPPCELLMGQSLHTRWDLLKPDLQKRVSQQQS